MLIQNNFGKVNHYPIYIQQKKEEIDFKLILQIVIF
jgi:hypothetical protein